MKTSSQRLSLNLDTLTCDLSRHRPNASLLLWRQYDPKPLPEGLNTLSFTLRLNKDLLLSRANPPCDLSLRKDNRTDDFCACLFVNERPHESQFIGEPALGVLGRSVVDDLKVLREPLELREAVASGPFVRRCVLQLEHPHLVRGCVGRDVSVDEADE